DNTTIRGWTNFAISDGFAARLSFLYDVSGSYFNQAEDAYDFGWDDNGDGDYDDQYDLKPDGIANVDQRRSKPAKGKDVNGGTDRYALRLSTLLSTSDSYKWLLSFDYFRDSSPGSFSVKDCEKAEGTYYACEGSQWDININHPGTLDFRLFTIRTEFIVDLSDNLRMEFRAANSRQFRDQYYDSDGGARTDDGHPAYGLTRDSGDSATSAAYTARYGEDAIVSHLIQGGPNGDNQYILDVLGFSSITIEPWNDLALITRYSTYDSRVVELQFSSIADPDNAVEWIAGIFFMHEDNAIRFDVESPILAAAKHPLAQSFVQPNRDIESLASFAQLEVPFTERFNMTFGARWTLDQKSDKNGLNYANGYNTPAYTLTLAELQSESPPPAGFPSAGDGTQYGVGERIPYNAYNLVGLAQDPELFQSDDFTLDQGT
ncbi:MAG: hypothetical protein K8963_09640, partial [Proteobacteria bacterium]|nr:hypothetical protein [Pseudomonadota bacterium]